MSLQIEIFSPSSSLFKGEATSLLAPAAKGQVEIFPEHTDYLTSLSEGLLQVNSPSGNQDYQVKGGFLKVSQNKVTVLVDSLL